MGTDFFRGLALVAIGLLAAIVSPAHSGEGGLFSLEPQRLEELRQEADRGNALAALFVAEHYDKCEHTFESFKAKCLESVPVNPYRDFRLAAHYYQIAADYGIPYAQHNLGRMYAEGDYLQQDYLEAAVWVAISFELLPISEERDWVFVEREQLLKMLTPVEIREVKRRVRNWRPKAP